MFGENNKKPYREELENIKYIRKYIVAKTIIKGQFFDDVNLTTKRSGRGIPAENWQKILGKNQNIIFLLMKTSKSKRICVITGSRAEFGLLKNLINELNKSKKIEKSN